MEPREREGQRRRRRWWLLALVVLAFAAFDLSRPPRSQWSTAALLWSIDLYQATLSPFFAARGVRCRFEPTCSHYGEASIREHGAIVGSARAAWRVLRCGPWTEPGTVDPP